MSEPNFEVGTQWEARCCLINIFNRMKTLVHSAKTQPNVSIVFLQAFHPVLGFVFPLCLCVSLRPSIMFRYVSSFKESVIHPRTDVPIHAKSAQLDKEFAAQSTTNGHLGDPPGEQNGSRSHRGAPRVPRPPPKVT